ncbi:MAG: hypothetical protein HQL45_14140 [Alphaproteobacteria bacterium]|nr:hypothetical protein [Alphaproteobacteria bacterium]
MKTPPGALQMKALQALSQDVCKTPAYLAEEIALPRKRTVSVLAALVMRGLADRRERGCYVRNPAGEVFLLSGQVITSGPIGPRQDDKPRRRKRTIRATAWHAIRIEKKFTLSDILADVACQGDGLPQLAGNVGRFITRLCRAGYLRELRREPGAAPGSNGFKRWSLIRDTGPDAPIYSDKRKAMFDPNTGEFYPLTGGRNG